MLDLLTSGLSVVFAPKMFLLLIFAVFLGTLFGALPGVSATMAVTLGIPFTYRMTPVDAIAFLVAIYCASVTGGGMTAILFKIPGVPSSAPTTYDGYPMAQRGEAGKALGVQLICSAIGGVFAAICMLLLSCLLYTSWDGWFNRWREKIITRDAEDLAMEVRQLLERASINLYMFQGGTNFGFYNGCSARGLSLIHI